MLHLEHKAKQQQTLFLKWPHIRTSQKRPILRPSNFRGHEVVNTHQQYCKKSQFNLGLPKQKLEIQSHKRQKDRIMDYGGIIWDPYLKTEVDWLERIKHQAARFITGEYKTREPGCITKMLIDLELPTLEKRRTAQRLIFMFKVVEGVVPAISPSDFVTKTRPKRLLKSRQYSDFISQNIVENSVINNSKDLVYQRANNEPYKNSFFIKTVLDWNHLDDNTVNQSTLESFKTALQHSY